MNATLSTPDVDLYTPVDPSRNGHRNGRKKEEKQQRRPNGEQRRERFEQACRDGQSLMTAIASMTGAGEFVGIADSFEEQVTRDHLAAFFAAELSSMVQVQVSVRPSPNSTIVAGIHVVRLFHDFFNALADRVDGE